MRHRLGVYKTKKEAEGPFRIWKVERIAKHGLKWERIGIDWELVYAMLSALRYLTQHLGVRSTTIAFSLHIISAHTICKEMKEEDTFP